MRKPQNHVTRGIAAKQHLEGTPFPDLTQAQVDWLATNLPPRCYDHNKELVEDHLKYAGKVDFAASLIQQWDDRLAGVSSEIDADAEIAHKQ